MVNTLVVVVLVRLAAAFVNTLLCHVAGDGRNERTWRSKLLLSCPTPVSPRIILRLGIFWKSRYVRALAWQNAKLERAVCIRHALHVPT